MAIKAIINSIDDVDETLRGLYVEKDDKFILDVTVVDGFALEDVSGLKSALRKKTEDWKKRGQELKAFDGITPDDARDAIKKIEDMGNEPDVETKIKEGIALREKQRADLHKKEVGQRDTRIKHLLSKLEGTLIDGSVIKAINENKGNVELLVPHIRKFVRMTESDDGEFATQVLDKDFKTPRMSLKSGSQEPMSISELVGEISNMDVFAPAFAGTGSAGSGATSARGGRGQPQSNADLMKLPPEERMKVARERNLTRK